MSETEWIKKIKELLPKEQVFEQEPLKKHCTFRVGGPADLYIQPEIAKIQSVVEICKQYHVPYTVIGNGSNILVSDKGIRGLVIEFGKQAGNIRWDGTTLKAEAGVLLSKAANEAASRGYGGMEFAAGIPGSVGGAVVMNAGAYGGEISQIITKATVLTPQGEVKTLAKEELDLSYRHSCIPQNQYLVLEAEFSLQKTESEEIFAKMEEYSRQRKEKQPLNYPSAGSTFKRPEGHFAGKLIQDAGLRGYQVGGAQVSEKHCGFVINKEQATAADIRTLMEDVSRIVYEKYQVKLEPEVKLLGEF
ncbi:MAG: UDP-N-acetylmuramate dehydrogenase [Lachnospiraceae bacterium]